MKLLPLGVLAFASLLSTSAMTLPEGTGHDLASPIGMPDSSNEARPGVSFVPDRLSTLTSSPSSSSPPQQRRSLWQLLLGEGGTGKGQNRRLVPSARFRPRDLRRHLSATSPPDDPKGACKPNNSTSVTNPSSNSTLSGSISNSTSSASPPSFNSSTPLPPSKVAVNITGTGATIMAAYWADWTASTLPPTSIDFTHFDILNYAFALPTSSFDLSLPTDPSGSLLRRFVAACRGGNTRAVLSIGGWGGSTYFSSAVRTADSRARFIANIIRVYQSYNLDGIDLDWEYPNDPGAGDNVYDPSDARNFQTFLQELRAALPAGALLTAAVTHAPWIGSNGNPVSSVARAAGALDYVMIMNYDVWGSRANPGPNAPLADLCGNSTLPNVNAAAGVRAWSAAGMPRNKILLGIPAYGYINTSSKTSLIQRSPLEKRLGVPLTSEDGSTTEGQIGFSKIVAAGALQKGPSGLFDGAGGFDKHWDDCSDTPFLTDGTRVVTYDDTSSIYDKGAFASAAGIGGISMWSLDGDTNEWDLTRSARDGMRSTSAVPL
ncbi:Glycoside hydrolase, family 18, catalytic domain protein [Kalmanozyma brasiliensis GHG001]|uniref:Glycoside hydrolase, family 18, catalytic domain protein n=1 Tax=Kalmanozyma brasiliensis (strain GHG001) TaxID=1365824 RepID=UPI001CE8E719|nr:Glycoside hydrolase, family 18, catalytic domain protein [Kalmanozyma brasiliensis GHG001]EST06786.2 Glycoside hydrolase, family 18, catalytic domain protein [Kalmanozyma brasiliensis GHG001]